MLELLYGFFTDSSFMPHGQCYLWKPSLLWSNIISDSLIAVAYYSIPISLVYFVHKRKDLPFKSVLLLFGAFIISCGTTHLMEIWTLWHPTYWLSSTLKAVTAFISVYTAITLVPIIPQALALPSPAQLEATNSQLEAALKNLVNTQSQLIQTEKISSMGQLVASIAHEINNPINFIYGNIHFINQYIQNLCQLIALYREAYPQPTLSIQTYQQEVEIDFVEEDLKKILSSIKIGAERIRELILSLRRFSRLDEAEIKQVDIHECLDSTLSLLQNRLKGQGKYPPVQVIKEYGNLPKVNCYPRQLNQVFINILTNAVDALEESFIKNQQSNLKEPKIHIQTKVVNKNQVKITIADNGLGMAEEVRQKIFDPFFTTKPLDSGTGLGMSISSQIIEKHCGKLECISSLYEGTELIIQLPIQMTFLK